MRGLAASVWTSASFSSSSSFAAKARSSSASRNNFVSPREDAAATSDEFWVVDGEILRLKRGSDKNELRMAVRSPPGENPNLSKKKIAKIRAQRVMATRIPKSERGQEEYWKTYLNRYQSVRDQWEKLYYDEVPEVQPDPVPRNKNDPYTILGLPRRPQQYSPIELKSAYREMALKYHPDHNPGKDAEAKFEKIWNAYKMLQHKRSWR